MKSQSKGMHNVLSKMFDKGGVDLHLEQIAELTELKPQEALYFLELLHERQCVSQFNQSDVFLWDVTFKGRQHIMEEEEFDDLPPDNLDYNIPF